MSRTYSLYIRVQSIQIYSYIFRSVDHSGLPDNKSNPAHIRDHTCYYSLNLSEVISKCYVVKFIVVILSVANSIFNKLAIESAHLVYTRVHSSLTDTRTVQSWAHTKMSWCMCRSSNSRSYTVHEDILKRTRKTSNYHPQLAKPSNLRAE